MIADWLVRALIGGAWSVLCQDTYWDGTQWVLVPKRGQSGLTREQLMACKHACQAHDSWERA